MSVRIEKDEQIDRAASGDSPSMQERLCRLIETADGEGGDNLAEDITDLLKRACDLFGVKNFSFCVVIDPRAWTMSDRVFTTYGTKWVERYLSKSYWKIDPVLAGFYRNEEEVYWGSLENYEKPSPSLTLFLRDAMAHGIGASGVARFLRLGDHGAYALSATADEVLHPFRARMGALRQELDFLMRYVFELASARRRRESAYLAALTDAEILILRLLASGARIEEISIPASGDIGTEQIVQSMLRKLGARNLPHAVLRFIEIRDQEFLPPIGMEIKSYRG